MVSPYFSKTFFIHLILLNEKYDAHQMSKSCSVPVVVEVEHPSYKATINGHAFTTPICPPQVSMGILQRFRSIIKYWEYKSNEMNVAVYSA